MAVSHLPVVLLGEIHGDPACYEAEREVVAGLKGVYDTLALEIDATQERLLRDYLRTARAPQDYAAFIAADMERTFSETAPEIVEMLAFMHDERDPQKGLRKLKRELVEKTLNGDDWFLKSRRDTHRLAAEACDQGYRIRCTDLPLGLIFEEMTSLILNPEVMRKRNHVMAQALARDVREGHGVIAVNGSAHLARFSGAPNSLKSELNQLHIPNLTFQLPSREAHPAFFNVDHVAASGREAVEVVQQDIARRTARQEWREHPFRRAADMGIRLLRLDARERDKDKA
ncbi:MAG: ChaN family lipoprotein [Verrucomicrobium sp.]|nr:ChaN family lipoprotein [Verrucomicrobium sp.]